MLFKHHDEALGEKQTHFPSTLNYNSHEKRHSEADSLWHHTGKICSVRRDWRGLLRSSGRHCVCVCKQHHHLHPEQHVSVIRTEHWFRINTSKSIRLHFSTSRAFVDDFTRSFSKLLLRSANILIVFMPWFSELLSHLKNLQAIRPCFNKLHISDTPPAGLWPCEKRQTRMAFIQQRHKRGAGTTLNVK